MENPLNCYGVSDIIRSYLKISDMDYLRILYVIATDGMYNITFNNYLTKIVHNKIHEVSYTPKQRFARFIIKKILPFCYIADYQFIAQILFGNPKEQGSLLLLTRHKDKIIKILTDKIEEKKFVSEKARKIHYTLHMKIKTDTIKPHVEFFHSGRRKSIKIYFINEIEDYTKYAKITMQKTLIDCQNKKYRLIDPYHDLHRRFYYDIEPSQFKLILRATSGEHLSRLINACHVMMNINHIQLLPMSEIYQKKYKQHIKNISKKHKQKMSEIYYLTTINQRLMRTIHHFEEAQKISPYINEQQYKTSLSKVNEITIKQVHENKKRISVLDKQEPTEDVQPEWNALLSHASQYKVIRDRKKEPNQPHFIDLYDLDKYQ